MKRVFKYVRGVGVRSLSTATILPPTPAFHSSIQAGRGWSCSVHLDAPISVHSSSTQLLALPFQAPDVLEAIGSPAHQLFSDGEQRRGLSTLLQSAVVCHHESKCPPLVCSPIRLVSPHGFNQGIVHERCPARLLESYFSCIAEG